MFLNLFYCGSGVSCNQFFFVGVQKVSCYRFSPGSRKFLTTASSPLGPRCNLIPFFCRSSWLSCKCFFYAGSLAYLTTASLLESASILQLLPLCSFCEYLAITLLLDLGSILLLLLCKGPGVSCKYFISAAVWEYLATAFLCRGQGISCLFLLC